MLRSKHATVLAFSTLLFLSLPVITYGQGYTAVLRMDTLQYYYHYPNMTEWHVLLYVDLFDENRHYLQPLPCGDYYWYTDKCNGEPPQVAPGCYMGTADGQWVWPHDTGSCDLSVEYQNFNLYVMVVIPGYGDVQTNEVRVPDNSLGYILGRKIAYLDQPLNGGGSYSYVGYLMDGGFYY